MPTFKHGKTAYVAIAAAATGTTAVSLGNVCTSASLTRPIDTAETTAFGSTGGKSFVTGIPGGTFSIQGTMDPTVDAALTGLIGLDYAVGFEYGPGGNTAASGQPKFACTGNLAANGYAAPGLILTNYQITAPVNGVVTFQADFQVTQGLTSPTAASITRSLY